MQSVDPGGAHLRTTYWHVLHVNAMALCVLGSGLSPAVSAALPQSASLCRAAIASGPHLLTGMAQYSSLMMERTAPRSEHAN